MINIDRDRKIQRDFFNKSIKNRKTDNSQELLYQELIFYRFNEILSNAYPVSKTLIKNWNKKVEKFIKSRPKTPLIWKMPSEFKSFLNKKYRLKKSIKELLWIEWIEIELMMNKEKSKNSNFSFNNKYRLSKKAKIKKLNYPIHKQEFQKKLTYLLIYEDSSTFETKWVELSYFLYQLLKSLNKKSLNEILNSKCLEFNIDTKETKELLKDTLKSLCNESILIQRR